MNETNKFDEIRALIAHNRIKEALELLLEDDYPDEFRDNIILLSSQFANWEKKERLNLVSGDIERSKITHGILKAILEFETTYVKGYRKIYKKVNLNNKNEIIKLYEKIEILLESTYVDEIQRKFPEEYAAFVKRNIEIHKKMLKLRAQDNLKIGHEYAIKKEILYEVKKCFSNKVDTNKTRLLISEIDKNPFFILDYLKNIHHNEAIIIHAITLLEKRIFLNAKLYKCIKYGVIGLITFLLYYLRVSTLIWYNNFLYNENGYNLRGFDSTGYDADGIDEQGFNIYHYDISGNSLIAITNDLYLGLAINFEIE